ncbi:MAG: RagB/SusD family nutrient uptake outer membrane protein [Bacteroidales bacterium]|nr:RagB/SusD family nutrient uptake outer membrane protein [Bacteroidales bacterium]
MKKIRTILFTCAAVLMTGACNLEKFPTTAINTEEAMESVSDCQAFRNGLYSGMKYAFSGAFVYYQDLQTDLFHAVKNFGNWGGPFYSYQLQPSESTCSSAWFGLYGYIGNANFLIDGTKKLLASETLNEADTKLVQQYYGEACYIRAHMYFNLTQYFCEDYDPDTASEVLGVPVVTKYEPTGDASKYPSRGTLDLVYEQILEDLAEAETYVTEPGSVNAKYVTKDVVTALQARVALTMHDYDTALLKAKSLIDGGKYALVSDAAAFAAGWLNDNLSETLWQVEMTGPDDTGNAYSYFIYNTTGEEGMDDPQYVPEDWVLDLYDQTNDIRFASWFDERELSVRNTGRLTLLVKYPGNPMLYASVTNYVNKPKVFRISEMYLIAAEAAIAKGNQDAVASKYINDLRAKRIAGWKNTDYTGDALVVELRQERVRELYGEGFRLNDLKRWHMGFTRTAGQDPAMVQPGEGYAKCTRPADDPYFLWPIPEDEIQANPQMEQNSAYKR